MPIHTITLTLAPSPSIAYVVDATVWTGDGFPKSGASEIEAATIRSVMIGREMRVLSRPIELADPDAQVLELMHGNDELLDLQINVAIRHHRAAQRRATDVRHAV